MSFILIFLKEIYLMTLSLNLRFLLAKITHSYNSNDGAPHIVANIFKFEVLKAQYLLVNKL